MPGLSRTKRRTFLKTLLAAGVAPFFSRRSPASEAEAVRISILHTTDLHGHILPTSTYEGVGDVGGLARCASQIRQWKAENPNWLLLDAGDIFQGTEVGFRTRGKVIADCFNALDYDAWTIGNHEFDWGIEPLAGVLETTRMPALSANGKFEGRKAGAIDSRSPFSRLQPGLIKKFGGIRIGVVGLTTPGLPYWLHPSLTGDFAAGPPAEAAREASAALRAQGADAIVLLTHMGSRPEGDDFANQLDEVAAAVPDAAVIIAGHTHRDIPSATLGGLPYTQANYYGINVGRTELFFDPSTNKLIRTEVSTLRMDSAIPLDPSVLSLSASKLEDSTRILSAPAGRLMEALSTRGGMANPSDVERLIATAIVSALSENRTPIDAVLHGLFSKQDLPSGAITIADVWQILPFENYLITAELTPAELREVMNEVFTRGRADRNLMGLQVKLEEAGKYPGVAAITDSKGQTLDPSRRYRVAMNTYDAASAGRRLMRLREILAEPAVNQNFHAVQTREALIRFLSKHGAGGVSKTDLLPA